MLTLIYKEPLLFDIIHLNKNNLNKYYKKFINQNKHNYSITNDKIDKKKLN